MSGSGGQNTRAARQDNNLLPRPGGGSRIGPMPRLAALALAFLAGCSSRPREDYDPAPLSEGPPPTVPQGATLPPPAAGTPSAARDVRELEPWNGQVITVEGIFEHDRGVHGIVRLASGLRVWLPHFDQHLQGDDWLRYAGRPCSATGVLHTYTRDIDGYRGPRLELRSFSGQE